MGKLSIAIVCTRYRYFGSKYLFRLLAVCLALGAVSQVLLAQDWDHLTGRDKIHDPTGVWLVTSSLHIPLPTSPAAFVVIAFHQGGTVTQDIQGEAAFDPSAVPVPPNNDAYNNNVITSPQHGVWQKTGWNTFAATLLHMEYHVSTNPEPGSPLLQFTVIQYSGRLTAAGDTMELTAQGTHYQPNGTQTDTFSFKGNGVRIPLTILPKTINPLPIPAVPQ